MKTEHVKTLERMLEEKRTRERDFSYDGAVVGPEKPANYLAALREEQAALEAAIRELTKQPTGGAA